MKKLVIVFLISIFFLTGCAETNEELTIELAATPTTGTAPLTVSFQGKVHNYEKFDKELYCTGMEWDYGEGEVIAMMPACLPYEEKRDVPFQSVYTETHTYETPGTYEARFAIIGSPLGKLLSKQITITVLPNEKMGCEQDSDCVPAECCHPTSVVNKQYAPNCAAISCTASCEGPLDCGAGHPECQERICIIVKDEVA